MALSDVLLEGGLTFKTCLDKGGGGEEGYNQKILRGISFMDGPLPKNLTIQILKRKNFVTF